MWKIVAPVVLFASISMGADPKPGVVSLVDYTLADSTHDDICYDNEDKTKTCSASPFDKLDFMSEWNIEGVDCENLWITLIWRDLNLNASTRSWACPAPAYSNNLVIHGDCDTRVVAQGGHLLEPFTFSSPSKEGCLSLDVLYDADFTNGAKTRNAYIGTMHVNNYS